MAGPVTEHGDDWSEFMRGRHARRRHRNWPWAILGIALTVGGWALVAYRDELLPL